jgi:hypothetical protein
MSSAPTHDPRKDPDPSYQPLLDTPPFFIETKSNSGDRPLSP